MSGSKLRLKSSRRVMTISGSHEHGTKRTKHPATPHSLARSLFSSRTCEERHPEHVRLLHSLFPVHERMAGMLEPPHLRSARASVAERTMVPLFLQWFCSIHLAQPIKGIPNTLQHSETV